MPVQAVCPSCGVTLRMPATTHGRYARCPKCGGRVERPQAPPAEAGEFTPPPVRAAALPAWIDGAPPGEAVPPPPVREPLRPCPYCAELIRPDAVKCRYCGEMLDGARRPAPKRPWYSVRVLPIVGAFLFILGLLGVFVFWTMDTTVAVPDTEFLGERISGGRVHNLGLMQQQRNGLMVCGGMALAGLVMMAAGHVSDKRRG